MDKNSPVVRYLHFVLLGRRVGLDGHWPSMLIYEHQTDDHAQRARTLFREMEGLGYLTAERILVGPNSIPAWRFEVTRAGKEYFISIDDPKYHQPSPFTTWAK